MSSYTEWVQKKRPTVTLDDMRRHLPKCRTESQYKVGMKIRPSNRMDSGEYEYTLTSPLARTAKDLQSEYKLKSGKVRTFRPYLHPRDMLELGIFEGKIINDCMDEFPAEWFEPSLRRGTLSPGGPDPSVNLYGLKSRESLQMWENTNKIKGDDNRGWFQWYCRYALGRRDEKIDTIQMKRWKRIARWMGKFRAGSGTTKMRQLLLQWSWPHDIGDSTTPL